jgi:hypothetical protein
MKITKILSKTFVRLGLAGSVFALAIAFLGSSAYAAGAKCYFPGAATIPDGVGDCTAFGNDVLNSIVAQNKDINDASLCFKLVIVDNRVAVQGANCQYAPFTLIPQPSAGAPDAVTTTTPVSPDTNPGETNISRNDAVQCDGSTPGGLQNCLSNKNPLVSRFNQLINLLGIGVGVIVVIMIIVGGIQYTTAGSNPQAVSEAKKRILNAIIALVAFILLYSLLQWLVPGGIF